jgi:hypothetical protein
MSVSRYSLKLNDTTGGRGFDAATSTISAEVL